MFDRALIHKNHVLCAGLIACAGFVGCDQETTRTTPTPGTTPGTTTAPGATVDTTTSSLTGENGGEAEVRTISAAQGAAASGVAEGLKVDRTMPETLFAGSNNRYTLRVTNDGESSLYNVVIHEAVSSNLTLDGMEGTPLNTEDSELAGRTHYQHRIGSLKPGASREITVDGQIADGQRLDICTWTTYDAADCQTFELANPELVLQHDFVNAEGQVISQAYACDEVYVRYRLMNQGTGTTPPVTVMEQLPGGLTFEQGQNQNNVEVGEVAANESMDSETYRLMLPEQARGRTITARAVATADRVGEVADSSTLQILDPSLQFEVNGPSEAYVNQPVQMQVRLMNNSEAPVYNANVSLPIPEDAERLRISRGDISRGDDGNFTIEQIAAGQSMDFTVDFVAQEPGMIESRATANAYCVAEIARPVSLNVRGIPALQVEVIDSTDPVQVGENTVYEIKIINEGSAEDLNIQITAQLPQGFSFVSAEGEPQVTAEGNTLNFSKIDALSPGQEMISQITVKADRALQSKLRIDVQSDELNQTLREEEPTTSY